METKRTSTKDIIAYLSEKFPACFSTQGAAKPLKVGIFQDLAQALDGDETVSKTRLRQALRHYTSSWRYLKSVKQGVHRVDISGADCDLIDEAQAQYAAQQLKESQEKFANKNPKDNADKKGYKGHKAGEKSDKDSNSKRSKPNTKHVKSHKGKAKGAESKPSVKLKQVESSALTVGMQVKVKFGNAPMDATITEVAGDDVSVQLTTGMVIKTQAAKIYTV